jgi:hypothetical protein
MDITSFEKSFSDGIGSSRATCNCGKEYYNFDRGWSWEEGELEELESDPNAQGLEWSIGYVTFEGTTYVVDCNCWHERAKQIMNFIDNHSRKIAAYLKEERERKQTELNNLPVIDVD